MDLELLDWLNTITFPQEAKYADLSYAKKAYSIFVDDLKHSFTTRACIFATLHRPATELLMDMLEESGLTTMVGKVNMDRNGAPELQEKSAQASAQDTRQWLEEIKGRYDHTYPILTPRFTPSCTDELMTELGKIQREYHIPIQSHLSENFGEIAWVKELCPTSRFYGMRMICLDCLERNLQQTKKSPILLLQAAIHALLSWPTVFIPQMRKSR